jgi:hypothetical protein
MIMALTTMLSSVPCTCGPDGIAGFCSSSITNRSFRCRRQARAKKSFSIFGTFKKSGRTTAETCDLSWRVNFAGFASKAD